jgi:anti-sigma factor RsiW
MNKPDDRLLSALIDGEADEGELRGLMGPVDASAPLSGSLLKRHAILRGLSDATREHATRHRAPARLKMLPASVGTAPEAKPRFWASWFEPRLAGAVLVTAILSVGVTTLVLREDRTRMLESELVSLQLRTLMAPNQVDVASADTHTVKPWFNGRISYSPPVEDFATQGYPLVGGRLEVIGEQPVSTLVYRHKQHLISLHVLPARLGARYAALGTAQREGFNILTAEQGGFVYVAVSDLNAAELAGLLRLASAAR